MFKNDSTLTKTKAKQTSDSIKLVYEVPECCRSPVQVGRTLPFSFYENNHAISDCSVSFVTIYGDLITYLKHPDLADHGLSVYLTHVVARVIPLHIPDVQLPSIYPVV